MSDILGTAMAILANEKNAGETRGYNSLEAQKHRDWLTEMSNTAIQRKMADAKAAGLNPILAMNENATGAITPSGSSASTGIGNAAPTTDATLTAIQKSFAEKKNIDADTAVKEAQINEINAKTNLTGTTAEKTKADIDKMQYEIQKMKTEKDETEQRIKNLKEEIKLTNAEGKKKQIEAEIAEETKENEILTTKIRNWVSIVKDGIIGIGTATGLAVGATRAIAGKAVKYKTGVR